MAKGERYPLSGAQIAAAHLMEALRPFCERIAFAGSIRRQRPTVADIDLVAILQDDGTPWAVPVNRSGIVAMVEGLGWRLDHDGEQTLTFHREGQPHVDLYLATPATWGVLLLIRTGSAAHNVKVAQAARKCLPWRKLTHRGVEDSHGVLIAGATEEDCFAAVGMPYVAPEEREAPELARMVGSGI